MSHKSNDEETGSQGDQSRIKDVWNHNLEEEILVISGLLEDFPIISMDTEFPGFYKTNENSPTPMSSYELIKNNVDILKLIQVGITLANQKGEMPAGVHTWQFNLHFDLNKDKFAPESIDLLTKAGINFSYLTQHGIDSLSFADNLLSSGLVINEDITWVTFHGAFDYAYLVKLLTNQVLPQTVEKFIAITKVFFPKMYDAKIIAAETDNIKGSSLQKLANELSVKRTGAQHQAGSDAHITLLCYIELLKNYYDENMSNTFLNRIYGIGADSFMYKGNTSGFATDTINNYTYNNPQFYYPQMFNYTNMGNVAADFYMGMNNVNLNMGGPNHPSAQQTPDMNQSPFYYYSNQ